MASTMQQIQQEQKERQQWASLDPVTLVVAARNSLYTEIQHGSGNPLPVSVAAPLEELITRFEQQTRASLGTSSRMTGQQSQQ